MQRDAEARVVVGHRNPHLLFGKLGQDLDRWVTQNVLPTKLFERQHVGEKVA